MSAPVLIADVDHERLERVRRFVEQEGVEAVMAIDAREAMRHFVRRRPLVTVLCADESNELGLRLCRDMKSLKTGLGLAIIVVAPRESRAAAFESGCDAFVTQTADSRSLKRTVRRLLAVARKSPPPVAIELIA